VVGVIIGAFLGVLGSAVTPLATSVLAAGGTVAAVAAFVGLLADQERRWRRSDASLESHFLPDGTPSMAVTAFGDRTSRNRGRAAFPALAGADSARTGAGKAAS
jgi:hypothetical protein